MADNHTLPATGDVVRSTETDGVKTQHVIVSTTDLPLGLIAGHSEGLKFGRVKSIDAADNAVDIWSFADDAASPRADTKTFQTVASTIYLTSSSASDTAVTVTVDYIDANGAAQTVTG
ncbi:MAG: hypothetical protein GY905_15560, partial [Gammaproteobacteria bacterium]|nr:hypothetical protein [Gammaproteobacteria bacterium]